MPTKVVTAPKIYHWSSAGHIKVQRVGNLLVASKTSLKEQLTGRPALEAPLEQQGDLLWGAKQIADYVNELRAGGEGRGSPPKREPPPGRHQGDGKSPKHRQQRCQLNRSRAASRNA